MADLSLYEFIAREVKRMSSVCNPLLKGNIYPLIMHEVERCIIVAVLEETSHNYFVAAKILGISRNKLYRKIAQHNIHSKSLIKLTKKAYEQFHK